MLNKLIAFSVITILTFTFTISFIVDKPSNGLLAFVGIGIYVTGLGAAWRLLTIKTKNNAEIL